MSRGRGRSVENPGGFGALQALVPAPRKTAGWVPWDCIGLFWCLVPGG